MYSCNTLILQFFTFDDLLFTRDRFHQTETSGIFNTTNVSMDHGTAYGDGSLPCRMMNP